MEHGTQPLHCRPGEFAAGGSRDEDRRRLDACARGIVRNQREYAQESGSYDDNAAARSMAMISIVELGASHKVMQQCCAITVCSCAHKTIILHTMLHSSLCAARYLEHKSFVGSHCACLVPRYSGRQHNCVRWLL